MASYRIYDGFFDNLPVRLLNDRQFRRRLLAALRGETNEFTPFVRIEHGRPPAHGWRAIRAAIFARDDYTCQRCGERGWRLECDHIVPVVRGGGHGDDNLQTLCRRCNRRKWAH